MSTLQGAPTSAPNAAVAALVRAVDRVGGVGALAARIGVTQGAVSNWKTRGRVPAEHCPAIERATNRQVTCEQLCPTTDWAFIRAQGEPQTEFEA
ncbi:helix-turn-helix domain-containing protein [Pigmentiphaga litoralis]|uniref:helix-turn-helix domain-containing protein n=1 Tax=Pigmentiphaga litoralis TaxID=516702 RepID=UPI00167538E3